VSWLLNYLRHVRKMKWASPILVPIDNKAKVKPIEPWPAPPALLVRRNPSNCFSGDSADTHDCGQLSPFG
jgi:hypothetical protein